MTRLCRLWLNGRNQRLPTTVAELIPDLLQLNAELLSHPAAISTHPLVSALAERDPLLHFLCPLARALVRLESGSCDATEAEAALATCWLVDDSAIHRPEDWQPGDNLEVVETVEHQIDAAFQGHPIALTFHSEADLLYCSEEFKSHITAATAADLLAEQGDLQALATPEALFGWLAGHVSDPVARPEGEDEPLCGIRYQLRAIGGLVVDGPVLVNGYHEVSLEELNEDYQQRPDSEAFCWLHALDAVQAQQLGLASAQPSAYGGVDDGESLPAYPAWVPLDADLEECWINAEQLQESYAQGRRLRTGTSPIRLELGSGLDWDPRHDSEPFPDEEMEEGSLIFPDGHRPLLVIPIDPDGGDQPENLVGIYPYLVRLAELASAGKRG